MSVTGVMVPLGDRGQVRPQAPAQQSDNDPAPSALDQMMATMRVVQDDHGGHPQAVIDDAYVPIMRQLKQLGWKDRDLVFDPGANNAYSPDKVWAGAAKARADARARGQPDPFPQLPQTRGEFDQGWRGAELSRQERDQRIAQQSGWMPWLAGQAAGGLSDPVTWVTAPLGGGAGVSMSRMILREMVINAATEAIEQPFINQDRRKLGRPDMTTGERVQGVVMAGLVGGLLPPVLHTSGRVIGKTVDLGAAAGRWGYERTPWDWRAGRAAGSNLGQMDDAQLAQFVGERFPLGERTPGQRAAINVVERQGEISASSPFETSYAGLGVHEQRLNAATAQMAGQPVVTAPRPRAAPVSDPGGDAAAFAGSKRAIGRAESPSDTEKNPNSSAEGRYQFTDGTWTAYYAKVYGKTGESRAAILAKKRDGAVQEKLMDRLLADNAATLRSIGAPVTKENLYFMHFAGEAGGRKLVQAADNVPVREVLGDKVIAANPFLRGMSAGEARAELARRVGGKAGPAVPGSGVDPAIGAAADYADSAARDAALAREAEMADLQQQRLRNDASDAAMRAGERAGAAAEGGAPEVPLLRRDLFDSDNEWRIAQAESDAAVLGNTPLVTRQSVWAEARDQLLGARQGEVRAALYHPEVGAIDVKWGDGKSGLGKIADKHPEVLNDLAELIDQMGVKSQSDNRVVLQSLDHRAVVSLDWHGEDQRWLLSAYKVEGKKAPSPTVDQGVGDGARDRSPSAGVDSGIAPMATESKLPPDLALIGKPWGFSEAEGLHSGFYRFETAKGPVTWDPETGRANGAIGQRSGVSADDIRDLVDPLGKLRARVEAADLAARSASGEFSDPGGAALALQGERLNHDMLRWAEEDGREFQIGEGDKQTVKQVLADLDGDAAAIAAIRECL